MNESSTANIESKYQRMDIKGKENIIIIRVSLVPQQFSLLLS